LTLILSYDKLTKLSQKAGAQNLAEIAGWQWIIDMLTWHSCPKRQTRKKEKIDSWHKPGWRGKLSKLSSRQQEKTWTLTIKQH